MSDIPCPFCERIECGGVCNLENTPAPLTAEERAIIRARGPIVEMAMDEDVCVGDWVSYYRGGRIVVSEVRYIQATLTGTELCTHDGTVDPRFILERRAAAPDREEAR